MRGDLQCNDNRFCGIKTSIDREYVKDELKKLDKNK